jgi:signal transduction histidine kinase
MVFAQPPSSFRTPFVPLESVLCTEELNRRPARKPNLEAVTGALVTLAQTLANSPERTLQQLVESALQLCIAHSAGISLLEEEDGQEIFRWHGVAGQYAPHLWGTTPRDFSPCGTVLDTDAVQLMSRLDRHFSYFADVAPPIAEALLVPFHVGGKAVGTVWVISHDQDRKFDVEDVRVMTMLGEFAAAAYQALSGPIALKSFIATIHEPLLVLDDRLRIRTASRSFYQTFRVTQEATEGRLLFELGDGHWNIPALRTLLEDMLPKKSVLENIEVTHDFPSLGPRIMLLNARKIYGEDNPAGLILLAIEDITERKRVEAELLRSNEESQRFAYVAAHDLRAPLNSSMTLLELLDHKTEKKMDASEHHLLSLARVNLKRLQVLMGDILAYTQVGGALNRRVLSLEEPLQIALSNLQAEIEATGARISHGPLPSAKVDCSMMTLVFQNLIGNALKFRAEAPPHVQIDCQRTDHEWLVSVADNGQGFDPQYVKQIFEPFARLHGSDTEGSGIGLASCARLIERPGGRIWADSAPGKGSTFYFTLPDN